MNETVALLLAWFAGLLLGIVFFGGLWWTVRKGILSQQPLLWFLGSLIVRMSTVLVGFYLVGRGHWERLLACLIGFMIARLIVTRFSGPPITLSHTSANEARHAP